MSDHAPDSKMTFSEAVEGRRSVRRFQPDLVPRDDVREMVRLATRAANAGNAQMWRFVAVDDSGLRERMRQAVEAVLDAMASWPELAGEGRALAAVGRSSTFFAAAPLVVAVLGLPYEAHGDRLLALRGLGPEARDRLRQRPDLQSIGAAVQLLVTAAHAMGYGGCWMSAPVLAAGQLEELLGVAPPARLVALVPIGKPARWPRVSQRVPVDDVLRFAGDL